MHNELAGKTVAILVADGFEQQEMTLPRRALEEAGAHVLIVSLGSGDVKGWEHDHYGDSFPVDTTVAETSVANFDALLIPGGVLHSDTLRASVAAVKFVRGFFQIDRPVAASCHGPQTLIDAGVVRDRTLTSYPSVRADLKNAGANWVDAAVVVDHHLVTSRGSADLNEFTEQMLVVFAGDAAVGRRSAHRMSA